MKLLSLNLYENAQFECGFDQSYLFLGSESAPDVTEVCKILQEKFNLKYENGLYVETWWDDNLYEEMVAFLDTVGYTLFEPTNIVLSYQG